MQKLYRAKSLPVSFEPSYSSSLSNNFNSFKKFHNKHKKKEDRPSSPLNLSKFEIEKRTIENSEQEMNQNKIEEKETYTKITRFEQNTHGIKSRRPESVYNEINTTKPSLVDKWKSSTIKMSDPTGLTFESNDKNLLENNSSLSSTTNRLIQNSRKSRECSPNFAANRMESILSPRTFTDRLPKRDCDNIDLRQTILQNRLESNQSPYSSFYNNINSTNERK